MDKLLFFVLCALAALMDMTVSFRVRSKSDKLSRSRARSESIYEHLESSGSSADAEAETIAAFEKELGRGPTPEENEEMRLQFLLTDFERNRDADFERVSPCLTAKESGSKSYPCVNGWRSHGKCIGPNDEFTKSGETHTGCVPTNDTRAWCSMHNDYRTNQYQWCFPCYEQPDGSQGGMEVVWTKVSEEFRCMDIAVTIGKGASRIYTFENGARNLQELFPAASASKWVVTVAIATAVRDGLLTFDSYAKDVLTPWWPTDAGDARSRIQLKHLLQFTSGFKNTGVTHLSHHPYHQACLNWDGSAKYRLEECVQQILDSAQHVAEPGTMWQYNSFHLQIALAMAVRESGQSPSQYLAERVFRNNGEQIMPSSYYKGNENPTVSLGLLTTGNDYDAFMREYISYKYLPKEIAEVLETEVLAVGMAAGQIEKMRPGVGFINTWDMGFFETPSLYGTCKGVGGTMLNCMNRDVGIYYIILPPVMDYVKKGPLRRLNAHGKDNVALERAKFWLEPKLYSAFEAEFGGDFLSVS